MQEELYGEVNVLNRKGLAMQQRRLHRTSIGRYEMEVMSGQLHLTAPRDLLTTAHDEDWNDLEDAIEIQLDREETIELVRLVRSIRLMELETQPSFPIRVDVTTEDITKQLQITFDFVKDLLLVCNDLREKGDEKEVEKILNIVRRQITGYQIIFSQELHSYILVPVAQS